MWAVGLGLVVVALPLLCFALARFWVHVVVRDSIQGSDLYMLKWCLEEQSRAWALVHLEFEGDQPWPAMVEAVRRNIAADIRHPQSTYRRGCDLQAQRYVFYADQTVDNIVDMVDSDAQFYQLNDPEMRELVFRFRTDGRAMAVLFDHTVWDGIRVFNEVLTPAIESTPFDSRWLVKARYWPVIAEGLMLYATVRMTLRWAHHHPLPTLEDANDQRALRHKLKKADVTALKRAAGTKFTAALLATWAIRVFEAVAPGRMKLRFGLVVGMENPRFRNNYSLLSLDVPRITDPVRMAQFLSRQIQSRRLEVLPLYDLISYLELQTLFKKRMVDCLFSPAAFERGAGTSASVSEIHLYMIPASTPLYSFSCSTGDDITISSSWNCPEISLKQLSSDACEVMRREGDVLVAE